MVVAEVLTGIALFKSSVDFIKSNINTVKDVGEIADTVEALFTSNEEVQRQRNKKAGMNVGDQLGIKSVAQEIIDAKLAAEKMREMRVMIDNRFGHGTWQTIVDERARRIREAKAEAERVRKERIRKQEELKENILKAFIILMVVGGMISAFTYLLILA